MTTNPNPPFLFIRDDGADPEATNVEINRILIRGDEVINRAPVMDGLQTVPNPVIFTGKTIFANQLNAEAVNIIPICTKAVRFYQDNAGIQDILDDATTFVQIEGATSITTDYTLKLPRSLGNAGDVIMDLLGDGQLSFESAGAGSGSVETAIPFTTDNALIRVDLVAGNEHIQQSDIILDDSDNLTGVTSIQLDENVDFAIDAGFTKYGFNAADSRTSATNFTAVGLEAGSSVTTSSGNTFIGANSGMSSAGGINNSCLGFDSASLIVTGSNNISIGQNSGSGWTNGAESTNINIGSIGSSSDSSTIRIGEMGTHGTNGTFIQGIFGATPGGASQHMIIDADGEIGSTSSGGLIGVTDTEQTLLGVGAMTNNISGNSNVVVGFNAANFMTTAGESVIIGAHAAENALNTGRGIFIGANSGLNADMTSGTIAIGFNSLQNLSGSTGNTVAIGHEAMMSCTSGGGNTCCGALTLKNLTTSVLNTALGRFAGTNIKDGCDSNCLIGAGAGTGIGLGVLGTGVGSSNTACGTNSLFVLGGIVAGDDFNTALGRSAGSLVTGSSNLYLGHLSGSNHGDPGGENNNICIMNPGVSAEQNTIHIGLPTHTSTFLAGVSGVIPSGTPQVVIMDPTTGELGEAQIKMSGSGTMSAVESINTTTLLNIESSNANTQALTFNASNAAGGMIFQFGSGGNEMTGTGAIDWHTSVNQSGEGIKFRATGIQGEIQLDAGTGGVRIMDSTGLFINDPTSAFQQQLIVPTIAADIQWTFPSSQGAASTVLENNGSGVLSWVTGGGSGTSPDSTGVLNGGLLTINGGDTTKFDIEDGDGLIYNPSTQVKTEVSWSGLTAQDNGGWTGILTYVSISSVGGVIYNTSKVTNAETRSQIFLGVLVHVDGVNIDVTNDEQCVLVNYVNSIRDLSEALGFINVSGNTMSSAASALTIAKSSGKLFKFGSNWLGAEDDPHVVSLGSLDTSVADTFQYRMRDGTSSALTLTDIIPNILDDGTAYPGTTYASNRFGVSRIYSFTSNNLKIQPPQFDYGNLDEARDSIEQEVFITEDSILENGMLIGFLITQGNTTDLTDANDALFISAGKLGTISSTGGSGGDASTNASTSTLNRVCVYADTSGKLLKEDSTVVLNSGVYTGVDSITLSPTTALGIQLDPFGVSAGNTSEVRFLELAANGAHYTSFKSPDALAANVNYTLPIDDGDASNFLQSNGSGVLSWVAASMGMPVNYLDGLIISDNSTSLKSVASGACRSDDNTTDLVYAGGTVNMAASGAGGLDTGAEASNTWYSIWIIGIGDTSITTLLSLSSTTPTLPGSYTKQRRIGWVRNDGSSNFYIYNTTDNSRDRMFLWGEEETVLELLTNGAATTYTNVDISELIPPTSTMAYINVNHVCNDGGQEFVTFRTAGLTGTSPTTNPYAHRCFAGNADSPDGSASTCFWIRTDATQNIEYANSSGSEQTDCWILGYKDSI